MSKQNKNNGHRSDYEVGRGKPPKHSRFKTGQSGNPRGRPKGTPNLKGALQAILEREIAMDVNGESKLLPMLEAVLTRLASMSLAGDPRAIAKFLDLVERHLPPEPEQSGSDLLADDLALLHQTLERHVSDR